MHFILMPGMAVPPLSVRCPQKTWRMLWPGHNIAAGTRPSLSSQSQKNTHTHTQKKTTDKYDAIICCIINIFKRSNETLEMPFLKSNMVTIYVYCGCMFTYFSLKNPVMSEKYLCSIIPRNKKNMHQDLAAEKMYRHFYRVTHTKASSVQKCIKA